MINVFCACSILQILLYINHLRFSPAPSLLRTNIESWKRLDSKNETIIINVLQVLNWTHQNIAHDGIIFIEDKTMANMNGTKSRLSMEIIWKIRKRMKIARISKKKNNFRLCDVNNFYWSLQILFLLLVCVFFCWIFLSLVIFWNSLLCFAVY